MAVINHSNSQYLNKTVSSGSISGTVVYFTIPWYPASSIERIRIWNTSSDTKNLSDIAIMNNGAHVRSSDVTGLDHIIYYDSTAKSVTAAGLYTATWNLDPAVYAEDLYCRPFIYIKVTIQSSVTNTTYYCNVVGKKQPSSSYINADATQVFKLDDYRVLVGTSQTGTGGTGGQIYDVTKLSIGNGGENASFFKFSSINDYIYIGSKKKIDHFEFQVGTASTVLSGTGQTLQAQIWTGSTWSSVNLNDNTSTGNVDTMKFSGLVETIGTGSSTWVPITLRPSTSILLPYDPLTSQQDRIIAGGYPIVVLPPNPDRYWTRFKLSTYSADVLINKILPINEIY
jgi:hypothetical protein